MRAGRCGSHQFQRPNSDTTAGTSSARITVASSRMPAARPVASTLTSVSGPDASEMKARKRISAALVTSRPVRPIPRTTAVSVDPVICQPKVFADLEASTLVLFTGRTRSASAVLAQQSAAMRNGDRRALMRRMVALAFDFKRELESGCLDSVGALLDENWRLKAQMSEGVSDAQIDGWYAKGIAHGALGGKLLGAGNGGFMMFFAPPERHPGIVKALPELQPVKFHFDRNGAQIVFFQPNE